MTIDLIRKLFDKSWQFQNELIRINYSAKGAIGTGSTKERSKTFTLETKLNVLRRLENNEKYRQFKK